MNQMNFDKMKALIETVENMAIRVKENDGYDALGIFMAGIMQLGIFHFYMTTDDKCFCEIMKQATQAVIDQNKNVPDVTDDIH